MKRIITGILIVALLISGCLALVGCNTVDKDNLARVMDRGTLRIGMEAGYQPFNWQQKTDANGAVAITGIDGYYANGYDVMIAKQLAEELGVELEIHAMKWGSLIAAVTAGTIDGIIAGMSPTAERKESIDFTDAYYTSNLVIVVREGSEIADCTSIDEVKELGANIVAQLGTFHADALEEIRTVTANELYETFPLMITSLNAKAIDGYIAEEPGALAGCAANEGLTYVELTNNDNGFTASAEDTQIAVGCLKEGTLTAKLNEILATISQETRNEMMENAIAFQPIGE